MPRYRYPRNTNRCLFHSLGSICQRLLLPAVFWYTQHQAAPTPAVLLQPTLSPPMAIGVKLLSHPNRTQQFHVSAALPLLPPGPVTVPSAKGCSPARSSHLHLRPPCDKSGRVLPTLVFPLQAPVQSVSLQRTPLSQHTMTNFGPVPASTSCCQPLAWT